MNLSKLKTLSFRAKLSIVAGIFLVFGLFGAVLIAQQQQEIRSRAAGDINGDYTGDLIGDDYRVAGKVIGNIIGNRNQVSNGVRGNVYGSANSLVGPVEGCINGDNNRVSGNVTGGVVGTNNIVTGTRGTGDCPLPGSNPTVTPIPTRPSTTCTDGIDNNQNELIDAGDPACHTDGNQNNNNSYDPSRSEGVVSPTATPTPSMAVVSGVTWYSDGTQSKSGPTGTSITAYATGAYANVGYQLVAGTSSGQNPSRPCSQNITVLNSNTRFAGSSGLIGNTIGTVNLAVGAWQICFREVGTGATATSPLVFTVTSVSTPTLTPTPTSTPIPTPTPSVGCRADGVTGGVEDGCITPTFSPTVPPTVPPGNTSLAINLLLHGIGRGGDSANPNSGGNANPRRTTRGATVEILNSQNQLVLTKQASITFNAAAGNFIAQVDLGNSFVTGAYTVKVKTTQFLKALVPGIQMITQGSVKQLPATFLVNGDIETVQGFNVINILDYNILIGCYSDFLPAADCTQANKPLADLNDDGEVNQFDYNLFLRELTNILGQ